MRRTLLVASVTISAACSSGPPAVCETLLECCDALPEQLVAACRQSYEQALEADADQLEAYCQSAVDTLESAQQCDPSVAETSDSPKPLPDLNPAQGLSQPCDPQYGLDACGAGLFCAAFDGRTVPTCYAERTRQHQETCGEDRHCTSGGCSEGGQCQALPGQDCAPGVGCVGATEICAPHDWDPRFVCQSIEAGEVNDVCSEDAHCMDGLVCQDYECERFGSVGGTCETSRTCDLGLACVDGRCAEPTGGVGAGCQPAQNDCPSGTHCEVLEIFPEPRFECVENGPAGPFEDCDDEVRCQAGLMCLMSQEGYSSCIAICRLDTRECSEGLQCNEVELPGQPPLEFGLCF